MGFDKETVGTYDRSAEAMATKFAGIGSRAADVELTFELAGNPEHARVVEIGCGDGRDAVEIVKHTDNYTGFDPSEGLLRLAKERNLKPTHAKFEFGDAATYPYPDNIEIVFAFASLLHVSKEAMQHVFGRLHENMSDGGLVMVSLKERTEYCHELQHDEFGNRLFYYYDVPTVESAASPGYRPIYEDHQQKGNTNWFTLVLQKV